jgi:hypothetical protein
MKEYQIRNDSPFDERVDKALLFKELFEQVDGACARIDINHPRGKEKWRHTKKIASEYMGNLYRHPTKAKRAWFDLEWQGNVLQFKICHDGIPFDQSENVGPIKDGLNFLKATPKIFIGSEKYDGVQFDISFENDEVNK